MSSTSKYAERNPVPSESGFEFSSAFNSGHHLQLDTTDGVPVALWVQNDDRGLWIELDPPRDPSAKNASYSGAGEDSSGVPIRAFVKQFPSRVNPGDIVFLPDVEILPKKAIIPPRKVKEEASS